MFAKSTIKQNSDGSLASLTSYSAATLTGTTAGTVVYHHPIQGSSWKLGQFYLNGYQNNTGTAQTITFGSAYTNLPAILKDDTSGGMSVNRTTLTLPINMGSPVTGWIYIAGN
jgi:hypothetical protein